MTDRTQPKSIQPVFLVGAERSGSTLLRLMLDFHPQIRFLPEHELLVDFMPEDPDTAPAYDVQSALEKDNIFRHYGYSLTPTASYRELAHKLLQQGWGTEPASVYGATVHRHLDKLSQLFPEARYIHLLRDPRDVARSAMKMGWDGTAFHATQAWVTVEHAWDDLKTRLRPDQWAEVKYEEIVVDPERVLSKLCEFLGTGFDAAMLSYPEHTTYSAVNSKLAEQWRRKASEREIREVETAAGALLTDRGYTLSGLPPLKLSAIERLSLSCRNRLGGFRFRCERFGTPLAILHAINNRLPKRFELTAVTRAVERIQQDHIK